MNLRPIKIISSEVSELIQQSQHYQAGLYPAESIHQDDPQQLLGQNVCFLGAYSKQDLMGIGAVKTIEADHPYGEIKNLFVDPKYRGQGASRAIMAALEQHMIEARIFVCRLETGVNQPESIGLYASLGYLERSPYGDYRPDPLSLFMEKKLTV